MMIAAGQAQANLGDGYAAAEQRWGKATSQEPAGDGVSVYYESNGWLINQLYNANGSAMAVRYYKPTVAGKGCNYITKEESDGLWLANTAGEGQTHWEYLPKSTSSQQMWYSSEQHTTVHLEMVQNKQGTWIHCMIFAQVPDGINLIDKVQSGVKPVSTDPTAIKA